jgi:hypothetical protein
VLTGAGYEDVRITPVTAPMTLGRDADDAAGFLLATGPVRHNLDGVAPEQVQRVRDELRAGIAPYETPEGVRLPGSVWVTAAHRRR